MNQVKFLECNELRELILSKKFLTTQPKPMSISTFLDKYSIHDSGLIGFWADELNRITLAIKWDTVWPHEKFSFDTSGVEYWPTLIISFSNVYKINWNMSQGYIFDTILSAKTNKLTPDEINLIFQDIYNARRFEVLEAVPYKTYFDGVFGGIDVIHDEKAVVYCLDYSGNPINL